MYWPLCFQVLACKLISIFDALFFSLWDEICNDQIVQITLCSVWEWNLNKTTCFCSLLYVLQINTGYLINKHTDWGTSNLVTSWLKGYVETNPTLFRLTWVWALSKEFKHFSLHSKLKKFHTLNDWNSWIGQLARILLWIDVAWCESTNRRCIEASHWLFDFIYN